MLPELHTVYSLLEDHQQRIIRLRIAIKNCEAEGASFGQLTDTLTQLLRVNMQLCHEVQEILVRYHAPL